MENNKKEEEQTVIEDTECSTEISLIKNRAKCDACLIIIHGIDLGKKFLLDKTEMTLGRDEYADIRINERNVSRSHAVIINKHDSFMIIDQSSTNGTFVNGERESKINIQDKDIILVGSTILKFILSDSIEVAYHDQIYNLSVKDNFLSIYSKSYFLQLLHYEFNRALRYKRELCVILLDLDHFKKVNDTFGHHAGDFVLKRIADFIKNSLRNNDIIGRYGGEEFSILLPETNANNGLIVAERLRTAIDNTVLKYKNCKIHVTISLGLSGFIPEYSHFSSSEDLIDKADQALYEAKKSGRNRAVHFSGYYHREETCNVDIVDSLLQIYNKKYFFKLFNVELSRSKKTGQDLSVVLFELDRFQHLADSYGRDACDFALKIITKAAQKLMRINDILARYDEEQLAIILPESTADDTMVIADRLRKSVENTIFKYSNTEVKLTISVGVASLAPVSYDLINRAEQALQESKASGGNKVVIAHYEKSQEVVVMDSFLQVYHKEYFYKQLNNELLRSKRYKRPLSVLLFCIDHFKHISEINSSQAENYVLNKLLFLVQKSLRYNDLLGRYDKEIFSILLIESNNELAKQVAERIRRTIDNFIFKYDDKEIQITMSLGTVSFIPETNIEISSDDILEKADQALSNAKELGQNIVVSERF